MTRCYEGNLGMGKTLNMVYDVMQKLKYQVRVISNTPIFFCTSNRKLDEKKDHDFFKKCPYNKQHLNAEYFPEAQKFYEAILKMSHGIIAVDEAGILFNRKFAKLPVETLIKLVQSRKQALDFYYTAQSFNMLDGTFKLITNEVFQCKKYHPFLTPKLPVIKPFAKDKIQFVDGRVFTARVVDPIFCIKRLSSGKRGTGWMYIKYTRKLYPRQYIPAFHAYDTLKIVNMMPVGYRDKNRGRAVTKSADFYEEGEQGVKFVLRPKVTN